MPGNLKKQGPRSPFRSAVLAFLLVGGLLLLMLFCGWLYAGLSGAVITTVLGALALMLVRKVSPQFVLLLSGARSIGSEDMPALSGIVAALCRRAGIAKVPSLYFLPSGVPTAFATGVGDQTVIVVSSGLLRLLITRELAGVLAHEITHISKHDVELMQLAGIVRQMTRLIAQVAILVAIATWLLDLFGSGEGVDGLSLGLLVAAPIVANLILGALSRQREYLADLEAVALTDDPAGLARAIELIEMAQKRIASGAFPGAVRIRPPRLLSSHPNPKDRIRRLRQLVAEEEPPGPDERIVIPDYFPDERKPRLSASVRTRGRLPPTGWMGR